MVAFRWSGLVWWAREELNLRPLPCQIQRALSGQDVARLRIVKEDEKAADKRRCEARAL
jgi:hypothetical protein